MGMKYSRSRGGSLRDFVVTSAVRPGGTGISILLNARLGAAISARKIESTRITEFIKVLKAQDGFTQKFDGRLWGSMVKFATVGMNKEITVTLWDGTEIIA